MGIGKQYHHHRFSKISLALFAMGLMGSLSAFGSSSAHATEALTLSISSDTLALNLTPSDAAGTFGSANINIDVTRQS